MSIGKYSADDQCSSMSLMSSSVLPAPVVKWWTCDKNEYFHDSASSTKCRSCDSVNNFSQKIRVGLQLVE
jgi:hypothetical protein